MKLSVIVPSLTGQVPESLRRQTEERDDVEVVVVTGVSPVGRARNEGLDRAQGEYVAWADSDDEVTEDWLAEILAAIERGPDVAFFDVKPEGWPCLGDLVYGGEGGLLPSAQVVRDVYENHRLQGHLVRIVSRRRLWDGLRFDTALAAWEDFLLLPQVLLRADRVLYVPKTLYRYVCRPRSVMTGLAADGRLANAETAIRRWREAPGEWRPAALRGSLAGVYDSLQALALDPHCRLDGGQAARARRCRLFLLRRCWRAGMGLRVLLRHVLAGLDLWAPQRLAHWYHFTYKPRRTQ